ncbi:DUF167 domain-containing protein [Candidatus Thorarchaeota archaeon]|nr:MAG: DUF167 domain-containing protein [Candidatus Thorarchaeota archaeon]
MTKGPVWDTERGTMIRVVVRPNSKEKELISEITQEAVFVNLSSQAREGKANIELLKRFSKILKISTSDINLITGYKSREKTLLITGKSASYIQEILST